jgi:ketosteroid isomerase-like protein
MKKKLLLFFIGFVVMMSACNQAEKGVVDKQKEIEAVKLVLEKYALANENQDINMIEEIWCPSDSIVSIGTESGEILQGFSHIKKAVQNQFETFTNTFISYRDQIISISKDGNTAWFSEIVNYNFILNEKAMQYEGLRYTGVLVKKDGKWKLVQTHMSVPVVPKTE